MTVIKILWKKRQENQQRTVFKIALIALKQLSKLFKNTENIKILQKKEKNLKWTETFEIPKAEISTPKLVQISANIADSPLCNIINKDLEK